jgi:hypothetical protein
MSKNEPMVLQIKTNLSKLNPQYKNLDIRSGNSAYTENKKIIYICLKDPYTGKYYTMNTLMYVTLHELAHLVSKNYDPNHGKEFKEQFNQILKQAAGVGIYDPKIPIPTTYCGVEAFAFV